MALSPRSPMDADMIVRAGGTSNARSNRLALLDRIERAAAWAAVSNPRNAGLATGVTVTDRGSTFPTECSAATLQALSNSPVFTRIGGAFAAAGIQSALYSAVIGATGGNLGSNNGRHVSAWRAAFGHAGRYIAFRMAANVSPIRFLVDGKYVSTVGLTLGTTAGGTAQYVLMDFGSRGTRRVEIEGQAGGVSFVGVYTEGSAKFFPLADTRPKYVFLGDSVTYGSGATHLGDGFAPVMGDWLGGDMTASGSGGTGWVQSSIYRFHERIANGDLSLGGTPDVIFLTGSGNDKALSQATVQANALTGLQSARALHPTTPIIVFGVEAASTGPSVQITDTEASIAAAVAAFDDDLCAFVPMAADAAGAWITGTGKVGGTTGTGNSDWVTSSDGTHPTDEGHAYLGRRYARGALKALRTMLAA